MINLETGKFDISQTYSLSVQYDNIFPSIVQNHKRTETVHVYSIPAIF